LLLTGALFALFKDDDRLAIRPVTFFCVVRWRSGACVNRLPNLTTGAWHKHLYTQTCNRNPPLPVIGNGVDTLSTTWMILTQARWFRLRFSMMTKQLGRWCVSFIRWSQKWLRRIDRVEQTRRTFAK